MADCTRYAENKKRDVGGTVAEWTHDYHTKLQRLTCIIYDRRLNMDMVEHGLVEKLTGDAIEHGLECPHHFYEKVAPLINRDPVDLRFHIMRRAMDLTERDMRCLYAQVCDVIGREYITISEEISRYA